MLEKRTNSFYTQSRRCAMLFFIIVGVLGISTSATATKNGCGADDDGQHCHLGDHYDGSETEQEWEADVELTKCNPADRECTGHGSFFMLHSDMVGSSEMARQVCAEIMDMEVAAFGKSSLWIDIHYDNDNLDNHDGPFETHGDDDPEGLYEPSGDDTARGETEHYHYLAATCQLRDGGGGNKGGGRKNR